MLQINDVHAGYGNLKILRGVNMQVPTGGIVTLLGGNGTGKSTLLKAVSGLIPLMEGEVLFDGVAISKMKPHERMRLGLVQVTQAKEAYPAMTVEENLVLGAYTRRDRARVPIWKGSLNFSRFFVSDASNCLALCQVVKFKCL